MLKLIKKQKGWRQLLFGLASFMVLFALEIEPAKAQATRPSSSGLPQLQPWLYQGNDPTSGQPSAPTRMNRNEDIPDLTNPEPLTVSPSRVLNRPGVDRLTQERLDELSRPDSLNPVLTPPFRDPSLAPSGRLQLTKSEILTEEKDGKTRHWLTGKFANLTNGWVDEVVVHFKIRDDFWIVQSGHFSVPTDCVSFGLQCLEFKFPLRETGKLEIAFVEWKYQDGSSGVSKGGIF